MVNFRPDDYGMRTAGTERMVQAGEVNTNQAANHIMPETENLSNADAAVIKNPKADVDPQDVEKSKQEQENKSITMREDVKLETYKNDLKSAIAYGDEIAQVDALDEIAKIEKERLTWDRNNDSNQNLCGILMRSLRGADVSEEIEDLSPKERRIYNEVKGTLKKVSAHNRGNIPEKLVMFYIKKSNGDYASYTPKEAQRLVEDRMFTESVEDAPIVAMELKEMLPSKARAQAANQAHRADSARQEAIDLTGGFDPKTGRWNR